MQLLRPVKLIALAAAILLAIAIIAPAAPAAAAPADYIRIVLLADTHLPAKSFDKFDPARQQKIIGTKTKVIDDINAWDDVSEVVVIGDVVADVGNAREYAFAAEYFSRLKKPAAFIVGNHDYIYTDQLGPGGKHIKADAATRAAKLQRFKETFGLSEVFYTQKLGGYLLIFLSPDSTDSRYLTQLSDRQLTWLNSQLRQDPFTPTLIFFHAPLEGTLSDYNKSVNTPSFIAQPAGAIRGLIEDNPQILLWLSGHTHTPATNPDFASAINIYGGRVLNIHNADLERATVWTNSLYLYDDRIVVKTFDHNAGAWLDDLERTIPVIR
jgi:Icc protein